MTSLVLSQVFGTPQNERGFFPAQPTPPRLQPPSSSVRWKLCCVHLPTNPTGRQTSQTTSTPTVFSSWWCETPTHPEHQQQPSNWESSHQASGHDKNPIKIMEFRILFGCFQSSLSEPCVFCWFHSWTPWQHLDFFTATFETWLEAAGVFAPPSRWGLGWSSGTWPWAPLHLLDPKNMGKFQKICRFCCCFILFENLKT